MQTTSYTRKPLLVEAVQVTEENLYDVAAWCGGDVYTATNKKKTIQVKVLHPLNTNQTKAQAGDWILKSAQGFKIYTDDAFQKGFERVVSAGEALRESLDKKGTDAAALAFHAPAMDTI